MPNDAPPTSLGDARADDLADSCLKACPKGDRLRQGAYLFEEIAGTKTLTCSRAKATAACVEALRKYVPAFDKRLPLAQKINFPRVMALNDVQHYSAACELDLAAKKQLVDTLQESYSHAALNEKLAFALTALPDCMIETFRAYIECPTAASVRRKLKGARFLAAYEKVPTARPQPGADCTDSRQEAAKYERVATTFAAMQGHESEPTMRNLACMLTDTELRHTEKWLQSVAFVQIKAVVAKQIEVTEIGEPWEIMHAFLWQIAQAP